MPVTNGVVIDMPFESSYWLSGHVDLIAEPETTSPTSLPCAGEQRSGIVLGDGSDSDDLLVRCGVQDISTAAFPDGCHSSIRL